MASKADRRVKSTNAKKPVVIYAIKTCPFCVSARNLFKERNVKASTIRLDKRSDGNDLREAISRLTNHNTLPAIWIGGKFIGGFSDLKGLDESGSLTELLRNAGAKSLADTAPEA